MGIVYIAVSGGWDRGLDECPEPVILTPETLDAELDAMLENMVQFYGDEENQIPLRTDRVMELLEIINEQEDTLFAKVKDAENELLGILRKELDQEGKIESIQYWSGHEGSFHAIYRKEIP